jgi:hypothetical protein
MRLKRYALSTRVTEEKKSYCLKYGLLGSQAVACEYEAQDKIIKGMQQFDTTVIPCQVYFKGALKHF